MKATASGSPFIVGLLAALLLWPAAVHQRPGLFFDSPGYVSAGEAGWRIIADRAGLGDPPPAAAAGTAPAGAPREVVATRAVAYSMFAAAAAGPGRAMWPAAAVQALALALLIVIAWRAMAPRASAVATAAAAAAAALGSSAAWFASFAMPDLFAGAMILAVALLACGLVRRRWEKLALAALAAAGVAVHASHVIVGAGLAAVVLALTLWRLLSGRRAEAGGGLWALGALAAGAAATMAMSQIGFGVASVAPKRLPFALARSIEDGPGRWYLEARCPERRYTICRYFTTFPERHTDVLFGPNGLRSRATASDMAAMRAEEPAILREIVRAYPLAQLRLSAGNFGRQLVAVGLGDIRFDGRIVPRAGGGMTLDRTERSHALRNLFSAVVLATMLAALAALLWRWRRMDERMRTLVVVAMLGVIGNAAVTGILSGVADRYQSRVAWVLPVLALGLWLAAQGRAAPRRDVHADEDAGGV